MNSTLLKTVTCGVVVALFVASGCSKAPQTPTTTSQQPPLEDAITAIQNNSNMPPQAKDQAIARIKEQQSRVVSQPQPR